MGEEESNGEAARVEMVTDTYRRPGGGREDEEKEEEEDEDENEILLYKIRSRIGRQIT